LLFVTVAVVACLALSATALAISVSSKTMQQRSNSNNSGTALRQHQWAVIRKLAFSSCTAYDMRPQPIWTEVHTWPAQESNTLLSFACGFHFAANSADAAYAGSEIWVSVVYESVADHVMRTLMYPRVQPQQPRALDTAWIKASQSVSQSVSRSVGQSVSVAISVISVLSMSPAVLDKHLNLLRLALVGVGRLLHVGTAKECCLFLQGIIPAAPDAWIWLGE
jgi:hypothetical protein